MLPVGTCLDVASSDLTGTENCDIQKWWESLRNISQNLLPEVASSEVTVPRVNVWSYRTSQFCLSEKDTILLVWEDK